MFQNEGCAYDDTIECPSMYRESNDTQCFTYHGIASYKGCLSCVERGDAPVRAVVRKSIRVPRVPVQEECRLPTKLMVYVDSHQACVNQCIQTQQCLLAKFDRVLTEAARHR